MPVLIGTMMLSFLLAIIMDGYAEVKAAFDNDKANVFGEGFNNSLAWAMVRALPLPGAYLIRNMQVG